MVPADTLTEIFPEITAIEDQDLRDQVLAAWQIACDETGITPGTLRGLQWQPPEQARLGIEDADLVEHVRAVTQGARALGEVMIERRGEDLSLDVVHAGGLVHDVSKLYEYDYSTGRHTAIGDRVGHPHYGLYVAGSVGLPVDVLHIIISHSSRTGVEPATLEAEIVRRADEVAAAAIRLQGVDDLREV